MRILKTELGICMIIGKREWNSVCLDLRFIAYPGYMETSAYGKLTVFTLVLRFKVLVLKVCICMFCLLILSSYFFYVLSTRPCNAARTSNGYPAGGKPLTQSQGVYTYQLNKIEFISD